jgi:translation initiation factor 1 (eIF-1/SUI1)
VSQLIKTSTHICTLIIEKLKNHYVTNSIIYNILQYQVIKTKLKIMDDFLDNNTENNDEIQEQKKIVIKHRKIKRATRTFLYNIDHWLEPADIKPISKAIKKKLATSSQVITDDDGCALTFNGDHTLVIKDLMLKYSKGLLTEDSFST